MKTFQIWLKEMAGTGPYIGNCKSTATYNVWGACSDQKIKKKKFKEWIETRINKV